MEGKYLYFANALSADNIAMYPASSFRGVEPIDTSSNSNPSNANARIIFYFLLMSTTSDVEDDNDKIILSINSNKHKEVVKEVVTRINAGTKDGGFITVADDVNSIYLHPDITGIESITTV